MTEIIPYFAGIITLAMGLAYFLGLKELKSNVHPFEHQQDANPSDLSK